MLTGTYDRGVKEVYVGPTTKRGKDLPSGKNYLTTLISKDGCVWFISLETIKIGFQLCGFLCNVKHLVKWWRWEGMKVFLASLDTFLPHGELGLEYEIMRGLRCYKAF